MNNHYENEDKGGGFYWCSGKLLKEKLVAAACNLLVNITGHEFVRNKLKKAMGFEQEHVL